MKSQIQQNQIDLINKIGTLDAILESLGRMHVDHKEEVEDMTKKISTRKLTLMEELFKLVSHLTV